MAKHKFSRESMPVQKGKISTEETASLAFQNRDPTPLDMEHNRMRLEGMTMTKHEPKR
jgi:hypothetical protein